MDGKAPRKIKYPTFKRLMELVSGWARMHPVNLIMKINGMFDTITFKRAGGWPDDKSQEIDPQFLMENVGDLIKQVLVRDRSVYMKTNMGFFRFYNK